jgi:hypothetical protein
MNERSEFLVVRGLDPRILAARPHSEWIAGPSPGNDE